MIAEALRPLCVPIDSLVPDASNPRIHDELNLRGLEASLRRFGQMKPIVVRAEDRVVVAGNGTLEVAKRLGWKEIAAVVAPFEKIDAIAFSIADNRTGELAAWDYAVIDKLAPMLLEEEAELFSGLSLEALLSPAQTDGSSSSEEADETPPGFGILISCHDQAAQLETFEKLTRLGYSCKVVAE